MSFNPSDAEDSYFHEKELRKMREQTETAAREMEAKEKTDLKELHWMHCPKCGLDLTEVTFMGVQVDTCFHCGGMYLDKGEIDKILTHDEPGMLQKMVSSFFGTSKKPE